MSKSPGTVAIWPPVSVSPAGPWKAIAPLLIVSRLLAAPMSTVPPATVVSKVSELTSVDANLADAVSREKLAKIVKLRQATARAIQQQLDVTQEQLTALQQSLRTVARVAPAYGRPAPRRSTLSVVG